MNFFNKFILNKISKFPISLYMILCSITKKIDLLAFLANCAVRVYFKIKINNQFNNLKDIQLDTT
jgi:hypothetical protein